MPDSQILSKLSNPNSYDAMFQYSISKLLVIAAVQQIAKLTAKDKFGQPLVIVNSVCPGAVKSDLSRGYYTMPGSAFVLGKLLDYVTKTGEEGARCIVMATTAGLKSHGLFWSKDHIEERSPLLLGETGEKLQGKIWEEMTEIWDKAGLKVSIKDRVVQVAGQDS